VSDPDALVRRSGVTNELSMTSSPAYAQQLVDEHRRAGVVPREVFPQSFNLADVLYWIGREPAFGKQAVSLAKRGRSRGRRHPSARANAA
jgi:hypothetical protein